LYVDKNTERTHTEIEYLSLFMEINSNKVKN